MPFQKGNNFGKRFKKGHRRTPEEEKKRSETVRKLVKEGKWRTSWVGGRRVSEGYVQLWMPEHHLASKLGYVAEHRLIAEIKIGRKLLPGEVVHHINENTIDNRPENLEVMSIGSHISLHQKGKANPGIEKNFKGKEPWRTVYRSSKIN